MQEETRLTWDGTKEEANYRKHKVKFEEAQSVFDDPQGITVFDPVHSTEEDRFITIGLSSAGRLLVVVHADQDPMIRIISARKASRREAKIYAKA